MIWIYNFFIIILLFLFSPFLLVKSFFNKRLRYGLKYRFFPLPIKFNEYFLIHVSSFGEAKSILPFSEALKKELGCNVSYSVFTDTAHELLKNKPSFLMPIDFYPLYILLFKNKPKIAIFFETEIWPSYITFLKKNHVPIVLINARMSAKSFNVYKKLSFFFGPIINRFDLVMAKTLEDAKRFRYFNKRTIVCGNIKKFKDKKIFNDVARDFKINTNKPILTLASFHREEIDLAVRIIFEFGDEFFIIVAPRHLEDLSYFESRFKSNSITYVKRTDNANANAVLLLDTMGELEKAYSISKVSIVGGSFDPCLKGHNPIEPLVYGNKVIIGPFVESFEEETQELVKDRLVCKVEAGLDYLIQLKKCVFDYKNQQTKGMVGDFKYILECYIINTVRVKN